MQSIIRLLFPVLVMLACATMGSSTRPTVPDYVVTLDAEDVQGTAPCNEIASWGAEPQRHTLICSEDGAVYLRRPGPRLVPLLRETGDGVSVFLNTQDLANVPLCQQLETWRDVPGGTTLLCRAREGAAPIVQWTSVIAVGADGETYLRKQK